LRKRCRSGVDRVIVESRLTRSERVITRRLSVDRRDLAMFRRFLDEGLRQLGQSTARIEESQAILALPFERLARDRPSPSALTPDGGLFGESGAARHRL